MTKINKNTVLGAALGFGAGYVIGRSVKSKSGGGNRNGGNRNNNKNYSSPGKNKTRITKDITIVKDNGRGGTKVRSIKKNIVVKNNSSTPNYGKVKSYKRKER